jgi:hypothetical protein
LKASLRTLRASIAADPDRFVGRCALVLGVLVLVLNMMVWA